MASASTKRELDKVKLGKRPSKKETDSASETESDVTEEDPDEEPEYFPDAIKWARYRNSKYDREDGAKGWHYGVMWQGYLKSLSDSEEFFDNFEFDENGKNQMLEDFWTAVGRPLRIDPEDGKTRIEPKGRLGEVLVPPEDLSLKWIKDARPRRSGKLFLIRQRKEKEGKKIQKRDSDYYWLRNLKKQKAPGLSNLGTDLTPTSSTANSPVESDNDVLERLKMTGTGKETGPKSQSAFSESSKGKGNVAKVKGNVNDNNKEKRAKAKEQLDSLFSDDEVVVVGGSRKRKSPQPTAEASTSTSTTNRVSPPKKQKTPPPKSIPPSAPPPPKVVVPVQTPINASQSSSSDTITIPTPAARRKVSEPLFLDDAPSPTASFEPLPGIFDLRQRSPSLTVKQDRKSPSPPPTRVPSPPPRPAPAPALELAEKPDPVSRPSGPVIGQTVLSSGPVAQMPVRLTESITKARSPSAPAPAHVMAKALTAPKSATVIQMPSPPSTATLVDPMSAAVISTKVSPTLQRSLSTTVPGASIPTDHVKASVFPGSDAMDIDIDEQTNAPPLPPPAGSATGKQPTPDVVIPSPTRESPLQPSPGSHHPSSPSHQYTPISPPRFGSDGGPNEAPKQSNATLPGPSATSSDTLTTSSRYDPGDPPSSVPKQNNTTLSGSSAAPSAATVSPPRYGFGDPPSSAPKQNNTTLSGPSAALSAAATSPPRYGFGDAPKKASTQKDSTLPKPASPTIPNTEPLSQSKPSDPIADRPRYVQPSRVKFIPEIVDPEAEARRRKIAQSHGRKGSGSNNAQSARPAHHPLPVRPANTIPPPSTYTNNVPHAPIPAPPAGSIRPPFHHPDRPIPTVATVPNVPVHPKSWGGSTPAGPSATRARPTDGYGQFGNSHLLDHMQPRSTGRVPPHSQVPPSITAGNRTPIWGGASPYVPTDRWMPGGASPYTSNQSPQWYPNPPIARPQPPQGYQGTNLPSPVSAFPYGAQSNYNDPRATYSPMHSSGSTTPYAGVPQASDPRRPGLAPATPMQYAMSPTHAGSSASGSIRVERLGQVALRLDGHESSFHLNAFRGAMPKQHLDGDAVLAITLASGSKEVYLSMDETELSLVDWQMRQGARVVQWAKLAGNAKEGEAKRRWEDVKVQSHEFGKTWVAYTELPQVDDAVNAHYALLVTSSENLESVILAPDLGLGLGPWTSLAEAGVALVVLALPLSSGPPPELPNPACPDSMLMMTDFKPPKTEINSSPGQLLASYGLSPQYFASLTGRRAVVYPNADNESDTLHGRIEKEFQAQNVMPHDERSLPEQVLFKNHKMARAVKSSTIRSTANRRTRFFAFGPALHLAPSQWGLTEIWATGGLVTFSPAMILRHPEKFDEIMHNIRMAPNWAAYIIPEVVQWVQSSWKTPTRCPKPTSAYQTFTRSLFLDQHLYHLSGSKASAGGGLAVSVCPPHYADTYACARWMDWLSRASDETHYQALVNLCFDYNNPSRAKMDGMDVDSEVIDLNLVDIETRQMEDLTAMRMRPHLLPYRRYIHIGEVSFGTEKRNKLAAGIECIDPDSFAAVLSGAI